MNIFIYYFWFILAILIFLLIKVNFKKLFNSITKHICYIGTQLSTTSHNMLIKFIKHFEYVNVFPYTLTTIISLCTLYLLCSHNLSFNSLAVLFCFLLVCFELTYFNTLDNKRKLYHLSSNDLVDCWMNGCVYYDTSNKKHPSYILFKFATANVIYIRDYNSLLNYIGYDNKNFYRAINFKWE